MKGREQLFYKNPNEIPNFEKRKYLENFSKIKIFYYHTNHLGTPQELTTQNGDVIWLSYDRAWGGSFDCFYKNQEVGNHAITSELLQPIKFQGQFFDKETSLHYNRFRYYDSDVGMFIQRDPIGLLGGSNVFQYAPNPVMWIDPWGLSPCDETAKKIPALPDNLVGTFAGGRYSSRILEKDIVLYRAGTKERPLGQFFSRDKPISEVQTRIDKAVLPVWPDGGKSPIDTVFKVKIPAGTTVHTGKVGSQGGHYVGGTQQIVVERPWEIEGVQVLGSWPLK